jgi:hypothetical protein
MYGNPAAVDGLEWAWVDEQLREADAYWATTPGRGHPHPRPVWGIWVDRLLYLSVGSQTLAAELGVGGAVTVNLGSVTDVVIVEGVSVGPADEADLVAAYNLKYEWNYAVADYGPFTAIAPVKIMAWQSSGWAGRGGFETTGRWRLMP